MMLQRMRIFFCCSIVLVFTAFYGCTKKWEEHNRMTDAAVANSLMQSISSSPNLTKFAELLAKSGYDKIISSSKTYTIWAPTDQALQSLDPAIISDSLKLKQFVGNHIANQAYLTGSE